MVTKFSSFVVRKCDNSTYGLSFAVCKNYSRKCTKH